jgi:hypothetical protein
MICWDNYTIRALFVLCLAYVCFLGAKGQSWDPAVQDLVDDVNYDSVYNRMQTFEDFGIKTAGSTALEETRDWITSLYQQWGYTDIELDEFQYSQHLVQNIIITKTGSLYPDTYLIIDGHYDTYGGPGVNDNGSGTAIILEMARLLKDVQTSYSIRFIHFTVEEMGLVGSEHYVDNTVIPENMDIRLVFNIDEVGGVAGEVNNTITCERDESPPASNNAASAAFTDTLATLTEIYSALNTSISYAYGSDYVPFMQNGYVVTGYYEYNESPYPHSINDSLSNLDPDYVFELAKASLASALYFSGMADPISDTPAQWREQYDFSVEPNPFVSRMRVENKYSFDAHLELIDLQGRPVKKAVLPAASRSHIQVDLQAGLYFYRILHDGRVLQTGKLIGK